MPNLQVPASQLERMTNKEYKFFLQLIFILVPFQYFLQPVKIYFLPITSLAFKRRSWSTTGNINIVGKIGNLFLESYLKFVPIKVDIIVVGVLIQYLTDTTHALIFLALVKI